MEINKDCGSDQAVFVVYWVEVSVTSHFIITQCCLCMENALKRFMQLKCCRCWSPVTQLNIAAVLVAISADHQGAEVTFKWSDEQWDCWVFPWTCFGAELDDILGADFIVCVLSSHTVIILPFIDMWALYSYDFHFFIYTSFQDDVVLIFSLLQSKMHAVITVVLSSAWQR